MKHPDFFKSLKTPVEEAQVGQPLWEIPGTLIVMARGTAPFQVEVSGVTLSFSSLRSRRERMKKHLLERHSPRPPVLGDY